MVPIMKHFHNGFEFFCNSISFEWNKDQGDKIIFIKKNPKMERISSGWSDSTGEDIDGNDLEIRF